MRTLFLLGALLFVATASHANSADATWVSSNTATADTAKTLCGQTRKALFHGICVNDVGGSGLITLSNSRVGTASPFAVIRSSYIVTSGCQFFDVQLSSGLTYTTSVANDNVTFLFNCY